MEPQLVADQPQPTLPPMVTPTPPVSPIIPTSKPKSRMVLLVGGILILGLGFTIGLLFNKNLSPNSQISPTPTSLFSPTPQAKPDPAPPDTANWKTYTNSDVTFKYPSGWVIDGNSIISTSPAIRLIVVPKGSTLMNECMKLMSTTPIRGLTVKKFERVSSGEMCSTNDTSPREIWVVASEGSYSPGISYKYSTLESDLAETTFDQILSTFKFIDGINTISPTIKPASVPLIPTTDWRIATAITFSIKYPSGFTSFVPPTHDSASFFRGDKAEGLATMSISRIGDPIAYPPELVYKGGSRREWYMKANYDSDHPKPNSLNFVDKLFGAIPGLEVYTGTHLDTILVAHGNNLYQLSGDIDTTSLETMASSITFK